MTRLLVGYDAAQRTTDFSLSGRGWFVTKKELAKAISEELGIPSLVALQAVQRVFDGITETLVEQGRIELRNFGVFEVKKRKPRKARNPRTGENVKVPAKAGRRLHAEGGDAERRARPVEGRARQRSMTRGASGESRPGLPPTKSPFLMTTIRRAVARWTGSSPRVAFLPAAAARPMTTNRLPILVWVMAVPVRAKADEALVV